MEWIHPAAAELIWMPNGNAQTGPTGQWQCHCTSTGQDASTKPEMGQIKISPVVMKLQHPQEFLCLMGMPGRNKCCWTSTKSYSKSSDRWNDGKAQRPCRCTLRESYSKRMERKMWEWMEIILPPPLLSFGKMGDYKNPWNNTQQ